MIKNRIRLTESQLHRVIKESLKKVLKEETYRGVSGTKFIWHGEWSDPEVLYKDRLLNANDVEEGLWIMYKEDCEEEGMKPSDDGFNKWCRSNPDLLASELDELLWAMDGCNESKRIGRKRTVKLKECELRNVIKNCINEALNEIGNSVKGQEMLGRLARRHEDNDKNATKSWEIEDYAQQQRKANRGIFGNKEKKLNRAFYKGWDGQ